MRADGDVVLGAYAEEVRDCILLRWGEDNGRFVGLAGGGGGGFDVDVAIAAEGGELVGGLPFVELLGGLVCGCVLFVYGDEAVVVGFGCHGLMLDDSAYQILCWYWVCTNQH